LRTSCCRHRLRGWSTSFLGTMSRRKTRARERRPDGAWEPSLVVTAHTRTPCRRVAKQVLPEAALSDEVALRHGGASGRADSPICPTPSRLSRSGCLGVASVTARRYLSRACEHRVDVARVAKAPHRGFSSFGTAPPTFICLDQRILSTDAERALRPPD